MCASGGIGIGCHTLGPQARRMRLGIGPGVQLHPRNANVGEAFEVLCRRVDEHADAGVQGIERCNHRRQSVTVSLRIESVIRSQLRIAIRSEEHTSELQSPMRISYAVFCLKKKKN